VPNSQLKGRVIFSVFAEIANIAVILDRVFEVFRLITWAKGAISGFLYEMTLAIAKKKIIMVFIDVLKPELERLVHSHIGEQISIKILRKNAPKIVV